MAGPNTLELAAAAEAAGLPCLLVGGNAVNLYAYGRTTFDVDLLVDEQDRAQWIEFFEEHGYRTYHATANFVRMHFAADPASALPVDLMLADKQTFEKMLAHRQRHELGNGIQLSLPAPLHLLAMKLHALRSPHRVEHSSDLQDVKHLIRAKTVDIQSSEFREILERYATDAVRQAIRELG